MLVYAIGVQRDSEITVKFNEAVDFSSIFRIGYVVSDLEGDSVRLRVEYSVNGVDWNRGVE